MIIKVINVGNINEHIVWINKALFNEYLTRESVSGVYKYSVINFVNVMCHRFQKSNMLRDLNGELKLKGKTIPNSNDKPTAMSEYPEKSKYI